MQPWSAVPRSLRFTSALATIALVGACADSANSPASVAGPSAAVTTAGSFITGGQTTTCISSTSPAGSYTITTSAVQPAGGAGTVVSPVVLTPGQCVTTFDRTVPSDNDASPSDPQSSVTNTVTVFPAGATIQRTDCVIDTGTSTPTDCVEPDASAAIETITFANFFHGTQVTFVFAPVVVSAPPPPPPPPPAGVCDRITLGGFVLGPLNISFGGNVGFNSKGVVAGNLTFKNHTTGELIQVKDPLTYTLATSGSIGSGFAETRVITGFATIDGKGSFPFELRLTDLGEPGTSDRIFLSVNGVVLIPEQELDGGNIQLHKCKK